MNKSVNLAVVPAPSSDKILAAVFIAIIIHVGIILGVNFSVTIPEKINKSISLTLVNIASEKAPEKASFLAQENQIEAGRKKQKATPPVQKIPKQLIPKAIKPKPVKPKKTKTNKQQQAHKKAANKVKIISQKKALIKTSSAAKPKPSKPKKTTQLTTAMLSKQIAQIGVKAMARQLNAENSRIKFINSVSAHKFQAANYIQQWQNKVERVGNLNYPTMARQQGFSGKLLLDVGIKHNGSIYNIRVRKSSGYKSLDDAAIKIVRMGAPYAPLPSELLKELDVLVISRVWQFSDETMSAR